MKRILIAFAVVGVVGVTLGEDVLFAHHGRGNAYDTTQELELEGVVAEVSWRNPHITIYFDATDGGRQCRNLGHRTQQHQSVSKAGIRPEFSAGRCRGDRPFQPRYRGE